ncbi:hypothetical protein [Streptomyces sp. NPDC054834]
MRTAVGAAALPLGIEAAQYAVPWLLRAADAQDIAGNLLGLALGMTALALPCPRDRSARSGSRGGHTVSALADPWTGS